MGINSITFDTDRYYEHLMMEEWCRANIGTGRWTYGTPKTWEGMGDNIWLMNSIFGNITIAFKDPKHLTMFLLRWA